MNSLFPTIAERARRLSPAAAILLGVACTLALAWIEWVSPSAVQVSWLYVFGVALVALSANRRVALTYSMIASAALAVAGAEPANDGSSSVLAVVLTTSSRFLGLMATGWLVAEFLALARNLETLTHERTLELKSEAQGHKRAEDALRQSEERYRTLSESSPDAIFILDRDLRVEYLNSAASQMLGRSVENALGKSQNELFPTQTAERQALTLRNVLESGTLFRRAELVPFPTGSRWIETRLVPMRDSSGATVAVMGVSRDISEWKRSEFLLQVQRDVGTGLSMTSDLNSALRRLLEVAVQMEGLDCGGVYLEDLETGELHLTAHLGLSEEFINRVARYSPDAAETRLVMAGKPIYSLHDELRKSGDSEGLRALAVLPLLHEGKVVGALNLASHKVDDIAGPTRVVIEAIAAQASGAIARLRAEEALHRNESRLRAVITGAPLVVFAGNRDGILTFQAGQAGNALSEALGGGLGRNIEEVFRGVPALLDDIRRAFSGEESSSMAEIGSMLFDCWFSPTRGREGAVSGFIGVATNVTERQRLQRQLLEVTDREQARLGQDIHDGLCQQLVSLAFDANALEDRLRAGHRPEATTTKRIADQLDEAITEARRLSRGLFPVRLEAEGLVSALEELARSTQERSGVRCHFQSDARVSIDDNAVATHLYRIAQEAVTNAIKHARANKVTIALQVTTDHLELRVQDDGIGILPEGQRQPGGMGLHIMDYRARTIGGTLRLRRNPTGGAIVSCRVTRPDSSKASVSLH